MVYGYDKVITECMDLTDYETVKIMSALNEAEKTQVMDSLASKLYESIMDRVTDIDFGSIPDSKGDITAIANYDKLVQCIDTIDKILTEFNQDKSELMIIKTAIDNTIQRKDIYMKSFSLDIHLPIVMYNTIVLSIVSAISLIISASIAFIGDAGGNSFKVKFDAVSYNKTKDNVLFKNLGRYNAAASNGDLDKGLEYALDMGKRNLMGIDTGLIVGAMALVGLALNIIPLLRELIFFFYSTKQSISDYFEIQSELLYINAEYVKNNTIANRTDKERKDIVKKQQKIADQFNKIALATKVDCMKASQKASVESQASDRKYKVKELVNTDTLQSIQNTDDVSSIF